MGIAGQLHNTGNLNKNTLSRIFTRPIIGATGGLGIGYTNQWLSPESDVDPFAIAFIGGFAGDVAVGGSNNICIGYEADLSANDISHGITIGYNMTSSENAGRKMIMNIGIPAGLIENFSHNLEHYLLFFLQV